MPKFLFSFLILFCSANAQAYNYCDVSFEVLVGAFPGLTYDGYYAACCQSAERYNDCYNEPEPTRPNNPQPTGGTENSTQSDYHTCPAGTTAEGQQVTGQPGQEVCGTDLQIYKCSSPGAWVPQGTFCGKEFTCEGRRCGDQPITGTPDQEVCGTDLQVWKCARSGYSTGHWVQQPQACVSDAIGMCPLYTEAVQVVAPKPQEVVMADANCGYFFGNYVCGCSRNWFGLLSCEEPQGGVTCSEKISGPSCTIAPGKCFDEEKKTGCCSKNATECLYFGDKVHALSYGVAPSISPLSRLSSIAAMANLGSTSSRIYQYLTKIGPGSSLTNGFYRKVIQSAQPVVSSMLEKAKACGADPACLERILKEFAGL